MMHNVLKSLKSLTLHYLRTQFPQKNTFGNFWRENLHIRTTFHKYKLENETFLMIFNHYAGSKPDILMALMQKIDKKWLCNRYTRKLYSTRMHLF